MPYLIKYDIVTDRADSNTEIRVNSFINETEIYSD